jgi:glucose-1-phosphate cytidylyltransferase
MKVVILAGGYGTRISEESLLKPKPMIEIGDNPILWHIMKYYSSLGFNDFIVCCGYKGYKIKSYFNNYALHHSNVTFDLSFREPPEIHGGSYEPWKVTLVDTGMNTETGGRLRHIKDFIGEDEKFLFTYGDGLSNVNLNALIHKHESLKNKLVTATAVRPSGRFGVFDTRGDDVISFKEKAEEDENWINGGFMVIERGVFDYIEGNSTSFERGTLAKLARLGKLGVYKHTGFWQCMDTQRDKTVLENIWKDGTAPWKIWK